MNTEEQKVSIVGLGYVGLPLAVLTRSKSYEVTGIDLDIEKVDMIQNGNVPFIDKELSKQLKIYPIVAQSNYDNVASANIIIVCVPTPVDADFMPDLSIVKSVCNEIGSRLQKNQLVMQASCEQAGICFEKDY